MASFAALAAASAVILLAGAGVAQRLAGGMLPFIAHPDAIDLTGQGAVEVMRSALMAAAPAALVLCAAAVAGLAGNLAQHGFLFAPKSIAPDLSKIGFGSGLKRLFGIDNLLNFLKSLFKLAAMTAVVWSVLKPRAGIVAGLAWLDPAALLPVMMSVVQALMVASLLVFGASAGVDYFVQRARFLQRMKMSREELKREHKDTEGDPHIKAKIKQYRNARAKTRMMANVPKATLVIMNPTHYAVALRYVQGETPAPICVAKGLDEGGAAHPRGGRGQPRAGGRGAAAGPRPVRLHRPRRDHPARAL